MDKKYIDQAGKYICTVKEPGNGWLDQPEGKAPFIRIPCIVDMPESPQHGNESVWYGYLGSKVSEKTGKTSRQTTEEKLKEVFGWDGNWDNEAGLDAFIGRKVRLQCDESEWQGKTQIKARWLNSLTTKKEKNREEFDRKRNMVLEQLKAEGKIPSTKRQEKVVDEDGDSIPF
jgi:hypothetical protein